MTWKIEGIFSDFRKLTHGVCQISVLGSIEFIMCTANFRRYSQTPQHQLYCFFLNSSSEAVSQIHSCIGNIKTCVIMNKLKTNDNKPEFLIIISPWAYFSDGIQLHAGQEYIHSSSAYKRALMS